MLWLMKCMNDRSIQTFCLRSCAEQRFADLISSMSLSSMRRWPVLMLT